MHSNSARITSKETNLPTLSLIPASSGDVPSLSRLPFLSHFYASVFIFSGSVPLPYSLSRKPRATPLLRFAGLFFVFFLLSALPARAGIVPGPGSSSWADTPDLSEYPLVLLNAAGTEGGGPEIYATANLLGTGRPIPTNRWYSSVVSQKYSFAHFGFPLAYQATAKGLDIDSPGSGIIVGTADNPVQIASFTADMSIIPTYANGDSLLSNDARLDTFSDWYISVVWSDTPHNSGDTLVATYGQGNPYVFFEMADSFHLTLDFAGTVNLYDSSGAAVPVGNSILDDAARIEAIFASNAQYGIFLPPGCTITHVRGAPNSQIRIDFPADTDHYFSVAALPSDAFFNLFYNHAYAWPTQSQVSWSYNPTSAEITATYQVTTTPRRFAQATTLTALLPHHQSRAVAPPPTQATYRTIRGTLNLVAANSFTTRDKFYGILPFLPDSGTYDTNALNSLLDQDWADLDAMAQPYAMYIGGQIMCKAASMIPIADQMGRAELRDSLIARVKTELENFSTYDGVEQKGYYYYDQEYKGYIIYDETFGSWAYTDQHFGIGYHLYAAAILSLYDTSFLANYGDFYDRVIDHLYEYQRNNNEFPFMRFLDPYEGHGHAHGMSPFGDGNNQESTGEAMASLGAAILFTTIRNNNASRRDALLWAYVTQAEAARKYWFHSDDDIYLPGYGKEMASIVWGGKAEYTTFFGGAPERVVGIQATPFFPTTLHFARDSAQVKLIYNEMQAAPGGPHPNEWYGTLWKLESVFDPAQAIADFDSSVVLNEGQYQNYSNIFHHIHNFHALGSIAPNVTSDFPLSATFDSPGRRSYIAFNPYATAKTVTFYENGSPLGSMTVPPGKILVEHFLSSVTETPVITSLSVSSDTPDRFFAPAPLDTSPAGDTVWFAAETQTITITVSVKSNNADTLTASAAFDSPPQTDGAVPLEAIFHLKPRHAVAETIVVLTVTDSGGAGDSVLLTFRPDTIAPDTVSLLQPPSGSSNQILPTFEWSSSSDSQSGLKNYILQISGNPGFTVLADSASLSPPDTNFTPSGPLADSLWFWRVLAVDSIGNVSFSPTDTFILSSPPSGVWYINDTSRVGDSFTFAVGAPDNAGTAPNAPKNSLGNIIPLLKAGETVYVDVGEIRETAVLSINTGPLWIIGADSFAADLDFGDSSSSGSLQFQILDSGIHLSNLRISNAFTGIHITAVTPKRASASLDSITLQSHGTALLVDTNSEGSLFQNIAITGCTTGIQVITSSFNRFQGIIIETPVGGGLDFVSSDSNTAQSVTVFSPGTFGLELNNSDGNIIESTTVSDAGAQGFLVTNGSDSNTLRTSSALSNASSGFLITSNSDSNLLSTNFSSGNLDGFEITVTSFYNLFWNNTTSGNLNQGFSVNSSFNFFDSNTIRNSGQQGIILLADTNTLTNNLVETAALQGINIQSRNNLLSGNTILTPGDAGFLVQGTGNTLDGNQVSNPAAQGYLVQAAFNDISGNTVVNATAHGFQVVSTGNDTFTGNLATGGLLSGFFFFSSTGLVIDSNVAYGNSQSGFSFDGDTGLTVTGNSARGNVLQGFSLTSGSNNMLLRGNAAETNGLEGFSLVGGGNNRLENNRARRNGSHGFLLTNADFVVFEANEAESNTGFAFLLDANSESPVLHKNNILADTLWVSVDTDNVDMTRNWWHTTDSNLIASRIQGNSSATARWIPFRLGKVDTTAGADTVAPKAPDTVAAVPDTSAGTIVVTWSLPTTNEEPSPFPVNASFFTVYRSSSSDTSLWIAIASVPFGTNSFADSHLIRGTTYYYRVTVSDTGDARYPNESFFSDSEASATAPNPVVRITEVLVLSSLPSHFTAGNGIDTTAGSDTVYFNNVGAGGNQQDTIVVAMSGGETLSFSQIFGDGPLEDTTAPYEFLVIIDPGLSDTVLTITAVETTGMTADTFFLFWDRDTTAPAGVTLDTPVGGTFVGTSTVQLVWTPPTDSQSGIRGYVVEVSDVPTFSSLQDSGFLYAPDTAFLVTLPNDSTWYWRVIAYDSVSNADTAAAPSDSFILITTGSGTSPVITKIAILSSTPAFFFDDPPILITSPPDTVYYNPSGAGAGQTDTITVFVSDDNETAVNGSPAFTVLQGGDSGVNKDSYTLVYQIPAASASSLISIVVVDTSGFYDTANVWFQADTNSPTLPILAAPADLTETNLVTISFSWASSSDTGAGLKEYLLQIDTAGTFANPLFDSSTSTNTFGTLTLPPNDTYFWRVVAVDNVSNTAPSAVRMLVVDTTSPTPPTLTAPSDLTETNAVTISFTWTAGADTIAGVSGYRLQVDTAGTFANPLFDSSTSTNTFGTLTLPANDTYSWRVLTADDASNTSVTAARVLVVDTLPPTIPGIVSPTGGTTVIAMPMTFDWNAAADSLSGVAGYRLQVDTSGTFTGPLTVDSTQAVPDTTATLGLDTYFWRVIVVDATGNTTASTTESFVVSAAAETVPPETFTLTNPVDQTETNEVVIAFRWTDAFDSTPPVTYRLIVDTDMAGNYVVDTTVPDTVEFVTVPANDTYLWRVIAIDNGGNTTQVGDSIFLVDTLPPTIPALNAPAGGVSLPSPIFLDWSAAADSLSGVASYRLQLDGTGTFAGVLAVDSVVNTPDTTLSLADDTYFWRVIAIDVTGNTTVSATDSFVVAGLDTTPPVFGATPSATPSSVTNTGTTPVVITVTVSDSGTVDTVVINLLPVGGAESTPFT
ncbi:MAG: hypothetical protein D6679_11835, partial [Candidatus Hydrogenedentota bacterium]